MESLFPELAYCTAKKLRCQFVDITRILRTEWFERQNSQLILKITFLKETRLVDLQKVN